MAFPLIPLIGAGIGAAGSLIGNAIGGSKNLEATNSTNKANKAIAKQQMAFQERMSNTAHQRQTSDMLKAGLNPILSATGGSGASQPGGASATMQTPDHSYVGKSLEAGISSGMNLMSTMSALKKQEADTANVSADTLNKLENGKMITAAIEGQNLTNAKTKGMTVPEIERARHEAKRSGIAKQREDAEGKFKALRAKEDEKNVWWDKKSEQVGDFFDNLTSGLNLKNIIKGSGKQKPRRLS